MNLLSIFFFFSGVILEIFGIHLAYRGNSSSLKLIMLGLFCILLGFLTRQSIYQ